MSLNKSETDQYVLGTGADELARLQQQHEAWTEVTFAAWKRAGVGPRAKVLDLGCGPGFASLELADLVGETGSVLAVDESENFVGYLNQKAKNLNLTQLRSVKADAMDLIATIGQDEKFDVVYCRWVLCWLKEPARAIASVKKILKPGGRFLIHDYFNWRSMGSAPRSPAIEKMVLAAVKSFTDRDGNVDVAADLPKLLRDAGFQLPTFTCHQRVAYGGSKDPALFWVLNWWRTYGPKLVTNGYLEAAVYTQAKKDMQILEDDPNRFFFCPPLFEFIATVN